MAKTDAKTKKPSAKKAKPAKTVKNETFAVIETGGKQYVVAVGDVVRIEKITDTEVGKKVSFDKVLMVDDGKVAQIGDPYLKGACIEAEVVEEGKGKKVNVLRFRAKSRHLKQRGHRQPYMDVRITAVK